MAKIESRSWTPRCSLGATQYCDWGSSAICAVHRPCATLDLCELKTTQPSTTLAHSQCQGTQGGGLCC